MPLYRKNKVQNRNEDHVAAVAGSIDFSNINQNSQMSVTLDQVQMHEAQLTEGQVSELFDRLTHIIAESPALSTEQREDLKFIVDGVGDQIRLNNQNNKQILRQLLRFLDDSVPEISQVVEEALATRTG